MIRTIAAWALPALALLAPALRADEDFQVVLRTGSGDEYTASTIKQSFKNALSKIGDKIPYRGKDIISGELLVREIGPFDYYAYRRLENPEMKLAPLAVVENADLAVRQLPSHPDTPAWEFNLLGETPKELAKLEIFYEDAPDKAVVYEPSRKKGDPLTLTQFGSYALHPPAKSKPVKFSATIQGLNGGTPTVSEGAWPKPEKYFLIRMNGYKGTRKELEDTISSKEMLGGTALDKFVIKGVTLALGEAGVLYDGIGDYRYDGNKLHISVPPHNKQEAARVYVRLPLTEKQMEAELETLNNLKKYDVTSLAQYIREQKPVPAAQDYVLTANAQPVWLELPKVVEGLPGAQRISYKRTLTLADADPTKANPAAYAALQAKFPEMYQITVYEFQVGAIVNVLPVKSSKGGDTVARAVGAPLTNWAVELSARVNNGKPPEEPAPPK